LRCMERRRLARVLAALLAPVEEGDVKKSRVQVAVMLETAE